MNKLSLVLIASAMFPLFMATLIALQDRSHESTISWLARIGAAANVGIQAVLIYFFWLQYQSGLNGNILTVSKSAMILGHQFFFDLNYDRVTLVFSSLTAFCCSTIVHFSRVYLHRETGFRKFFSLLFVLTAGMNLLSTANNLSVFFVGWEFIGLASFFLIAFYREQRVSVNNALKVFGVYRIGDLGLLAAMICLHLLAETHAGTAFSELSHMSPELLASNGLVYGCGFGILLAAMAKSAQFPFSFWLPRAMEGPTPSSAIFYGALSVHAGVLLLFRLQPLMTLFPFMDSLIVGVGLMTAILAFSASRTYPSIKGRLAMASVSQVGIIFIEVGMGFEKIALYHTVAHALLRSIQLLISPSVITHFLKADGEKSDTIGQKPRSLESLLPRRIRATIYAVSMQDHMVEFYLSRCYAKAQRFFQRENFVMIGISAAIFMALVIIASGQISAPLSAMFLVIAFILSISGLVTRADYGTKIVVLTASFALLIIATGLTHAKSEHISSGLLLVASLGALLFFIVPKRFKNIKNMAFHGMWSKHPKRSTLLFFTGAALIGVPPSPLFFFEDLVFNNALQTSTLLAILVGLTQAMNGLGIFKSISEMTMGAAPAILELEETEPSFSLKNILPETR